MRFPALCIREEKTIRTTVSLRRYRRAIPFLHPRVFVKAVTRTAWHEPLFGRASRVVHDVRSASCVIVDRRLVELLFPQYS
jgi:hypothetical protein